MRTKNLSDDRRAEDILRLEYDEAGPGVLPEVLVQPPLGEVSEARTRDGPHLVCVELGVCRDPEEVGPVLLAIIKRGQARRDSSAADLKLR